MYSLFKMFSFFVGFTDRHEDMHFFPYPDRTRSWIGVYMKNIFKWKKYSFRVIIHFNPLHPSPSLYLSGLYVSILQIKPFVVFFNLKVVTHGLKNYFCQQLLLWCSLRKTNHTQTNTNLHSSCSVESAVYIGQRHHASFVLQW